MAIGLAWALMPCGLLYSALLLASLSGGAGQGAATMAVFALGGALALVAGPAMWQRLTRVIGAIGVSRDAGTRLAGVLLCVDGLFALWMDLSASPSVIC
jgi:sulfite exporter TauE/SafE